MMNNMLDALKLVLKEIRNRWQRTRIIVRGDNYIDTEGGLFRFPHFWRRVGGLVPVLSKIGFHGFVF
jgi:hypothetical protein